MEANLIDRDVAEDYFGCSDWEILAKETLREVPLVDAVPVVRCRECKYHKPIDYCTKHKQTGWFDDNFCSYGEQREATHD